MFKRILGALGALVVSAALLAGCQSNTPSAAGAATAGPGDEKLRVVTTIFPPYDFVREIAGDQVELTMLLSPGAESHSYDPTPQDIITIQNCDVFLYVGGETDRWVERILESMDTGDMVLMPMMELVEVVEEELVEGMEDGHGHDEDGHDEDGHDEDGHDEDGHDEDGGDHEAEYDEHVWTSPRNASVIAGAIADTLAELDPQRDAAYRENCAAYQLQLAALDDAFLQLMDGSARGTLVFGDRFPFRYFADAYGLEYFAAFPGCSTETEASAATVAFLIDKVRDEEIPVVFHIELSNQKMADAICEGAGAKKLLLHSCHNVTRDEFESGATYLSLMWQNLENLKEALC